MLISICELKSYQSLKSLPHFSRLDTTVTEMTQRDGDDGGLPSQYTIVYFILPPSTLQLSSPQLCLLVSLLLISHTYRITINNLINFTYISSARHKIIISVTKSSSPSHNCDRDDVTEMTPERLSGRKSRLSV